LAWFKDFPSWHGSRWGFLCGPAIGVGFEALFKALALACGFLALVKAAPLFGFLALVEGLYYGGLDLSSGVFITANLNYQVASGELDLSSCVFITANLTSQVASLIFGSRWSSLRKVFCEWTNGNVDLDEASSVGRAVYL
jgi:hypothetical protein